MKLVPMWLRDMHGMHGETEVALYSDHLAAIEQARKEEREACAKFVEDNWGEYPLDGLAAAIRARKP